jgi:hypothetical protein
MYWIAELSVPLPPAKRRPAHTVFPSDGSLLKMLYLATMDITKNGRDTARTGDKSISSWRSILKNVFLEGICNRT